MLKLETILQAVGAYYDIPMRDLSSSTRRREVSHARHVAMYLARLHTRSTLMSIGRRLGSRDHTTVIHGAKKIRAMLKAGLNGLPAEIVELSARLGLPTPRIQISDN